MGAAFGPVSAGSEDGAGVGGGITGRGASGSGPMVSGTAPGLPRTSAS